MELGLLRVRKTLLCKLLRHYEAFKTLGSVGFENLWSGLLQYYRKPVKWSLRRALVWDLKTHEASFCDFMENLQSGA